MKNKNPELFPDKTTTFTFKIKESLKAEAEQAAEAKGLSLAAYIRFLLINDMKKKP